MGRLISQVLSYETARLNVGVAGTSFMTRLISYQVIGQS